MTHFLYIYHWTTPQGTMHHQGLVNCNEKKLYGLSRHSRVHHLHGSLECQFHPAFTIIFEKNENENRIDYIYNDKKNMINSTEKYSVYKCIYVLID